RRGTHAGLWISPQPALVMPAQAGTWVISMGEAPEEGQWPRRHRSRKDENRARPRSLIPPLKRRRRRKTRSTILRAVGAVHEHRDRTPRRARDLSHHGLHHVRQSGDPEKAGMDVGAVFVATYLAAAAGSIIMGLYANYPNRPVRQCSAQ